MSAYSATARREGKYWVVEVDGVGVTQGRNLAEAEAMAADLVVAMRQVPAEEVAVEMQVDLPAPLREQIVKTKKTRAELETLQVQVGELGRNVVKELRGAGLTGRDVAAVLGVSEQRVSQLAAGGRVGRPREKVTPVIVTAVDRTKRGRGGRTVARDAVTGKPSPRRRAPAQPE